MLLLNLLPLFHQLISLSSFLIKSCYTFSSQIPFFSKSPFPLQDWCAAAQSKRRKTWKRTPHQLTKHG
uniref:Uncharacterized protein n=1 Tax=Arundo donax TaxID=35708 RepID=A0A0A8ZA06_ARUDO